MTKRRIKWIIFICLFLTMLIYIMQPFIFKKSRIENIIKFELPDTIEIIEYKIGFNIYGVEPFYAKTGIDKETYDSISKNLVEGIDYVQFAHEHIIPYYKYKSLNLENAEEVKITQLMGGRGSLFLGGTTRILYYAITKDTDKYYLYVFY